MKILIATDGSPFSDVAVNEVIERPWPSESEFRVLTVMESSPFPYVSTDVYALPLDQTLAKARSVVEQIANSASNRIKSKGLNVTHFVRQGVTAEEILDEAKRWGADLIVVGTHGGRGISRFLLGSVAQRIATHAHCSVEIVRKPGLFSKQ
ncbi:MAG: universal stress protein [Acidobacteriota bacterium]